MTILQGTNCTWVGEANGTRPPGCPFCHGTLREAPIFWIMVDDIERGEYPWPGYMKTGPLPEWKSRPHPGYRAMWMWALEQQRCFRHVAHLRNSYKKHTGNDVEIEP
jgi:hypothetical protein